MEINSTRKMRRTGMTKGLRLGYGGRPYWSGRRAQRHYRKWWQTGLRVDETQIEANPGV